MFQVSITQHANKKVSRNIGWWWRNRIKATQTQRERDSRPETDNAHRRYSLMPMTHYPTVLWQTIGRVS